MVKGRSPLAVGQVDVGAVTDERGDDAPVPRPAVGEHDRFQKSCPSQAVHMVDFDLRVREQPVHHLDMPSLRRRDQRGAAVAVGETRVGAGRGGQLDDVEQALGARVEERVVQHLVALIHVRARADERLDRARVPAVARRHDRRTALRVAAVHVCAFFQ